MAKLKWDQWVAIDNESGQRFGEENTVEINSPEALVQAIGYAKRMLSNGVVYYRGQNNYYSSMIPSLYRKINDDSLIRKKTHAICGYIKSLSQNGRLFRGVHKSAIEGLLQHYGMKTRYLDFVDNIWIALWFASHRRIVAQGINIEKYIQHEGRFCFIYLVSFGNIEYTEDRGVYKTNDGFQIIDLRMAVGSGFLRPHAQHGIVVRKDCDINTITKESVNMNRNIEITLKIETKNAIEWIGSGVLARTSFVFPSPYYDIGYRTLRKNIKISQSISQIIGEIDTIW